MGVTAPGRAASARFGQLLPAPDVLDLGRQRLVCQVQGQGPQAQGSNWSPLSGHVQSQGTVLQHEGVLQRLQVPPGVTYESEEKV